jgi:hypothetical protein
MTSRLLGFGLAVAYVPQAYADVNVGRWAVAWLAIALLVWILPVGRWAIIGTALLALAALSFLWAPEPLNGLHEFLRLCLLGGAFVVGRAGCADEIFEGAAWGMIVNSAFATVQVFGLHPVMEAWSPAGLFGNRDFMAEAALLVIIPLVWKRRWFMAASILPALVLPMDRTVMVAAGVVTAAAVWQNNRTVTLVAMSAIFVIVAALSLSFAKYSSAWDR